MRKVWQRPRMIHQKAQQQVIIKSIIFMDQLLNSVQNGGGVAKEQSSYSQGIPHIQTINVSWKIHVLSYVYLTVEEIFSLTIPDFFTPGIVTSICCVIVICKKLAWAFVHHPVFWSSHCKNWEQCLLMQIDHVYRLIRRCMHRSSVI